jgi:hypothetical protein
MLRIPEIRKLKQKDYEFKASLGHTVKKKKKKRGKKDTQEINTQRNGQDLQ